MATRDRPPASSAAPFAATLERLLREPRAPTPEPRVLDETFGLYRLRERLPAHPSRPSRERFLATLAQHGGERRCVVERLAAGATPDDLARFIAAARIAVVLHAPSIVATFDVGRVGERYYVARDHVPGATLAELLARLAAARAPLPLAVVSHIVECVRAALEHAHERISPTTHEALGIVHGALDERTVLLGLTGDVFVADFDDATSALEREPAWTLPPALHDVEPTPATDVYLLGALVQRLLERAHPRASARARVPFDAALAPNPRERPPLEALVVDRDANARAELATLLAVHAGSPQLP